MEITEGKKVNNLLKGYNMLLYFSGSMLTDEPTEECVDDFWMTGIMKTFPVSSNNPRFLNAISVLRESCSQKGVCRKRLADDFNRLFNNGGYALPVESIWSDKSPLLVNDYESAKGFYESYGWRSKYEGVIPDDHLGVELLFLTLLIDKYLSLDDKACTKELSKEIRRFISDHLLTWIPQWNTRVQANAQTLCYKGIGTLIHAIMEDLDAIFTITGRSAS
jgi:TorA maturation chaperone TorD